MSIYWEHEGNTNLYHVIIENIGRVYSSPDKEKVIMYVAELKIKENIWREERILTHRMKSLPDKIRSMETAHEIRGLVRIKDVVEIIEEIIK